jgi:hypothetical protein
VILVLLDSKDPQGRKVWLVRKVRLVGRVPLDRLVLLVRREKPDCKDPPVLRVSAVKSGRLDHPAKKAHLEKRDLPDLSGPQVSEGRRDPRVLLAPWVQQDHPDLQALPYRQFRLQPPTSAPLTLAATPSRVRPTRF